jgi:FkbM family methyltransferase
VKKIQRTVKRILQIPYTKSDHDELILLKLKSSGPFSNVKRGNDEVELIYKDRHPIFARLWPHSDSMVIDQVLVREEYKTVTDFFKVNFPTQTKLNIIDAGANVGYSSLYFLNEFPQATVASVEPDSRNVQMLNRNLASFIDAGQLKVFQNGLMSEDGRNIVTTKDFRDGRDWSVTVAETQEESELKSITVNRICDQLGWGHVDILKIDIEGAERFVFDKSANLDYLQKVNTVAIEIHDEFGIRDTIYDHLKKYDFTIFNFWETSFGISKRLLK